MADNGTSADTGGDQSNTSYGYSGAGGDVSVYSGNFGDTNTINNDYTGQNYDVASGTLGGTTKQTGAAYDVASGTFGGDNYSAPGGYGWNEVQPGLSAPDVSGRDLSAQDKFWSDTYYKDAYTPKPAPTPADTLGSDSFNPFTFAGDLATSYYLTFTDPNVGRPGYTYGSAANVALYTPFVNDAAKQNGLDPRLLMSLLMHESQLDPGALSDTGGYGFGQLFPAAATDVGGASNVNANIFGSPFANIYTSAAYLKQQINKFPGDPNAEAKGVAAYNKGYGNWQAGFSYGVQVVKDAYGGAATKPAGRTPTATPPAATPAATPAAPGSKKTLFGIPVPKFMQPSDPNAPPAAPVKAPNLVPAILRPLLSMPSGTTPDTNPSGKGGSAAPTYAAVPAYNTGGAPMGATNVSASDGGAVLTPAGYLVPPAPNVGFPGVTDSLLGSDVTGFFSNINKLLSLLTPENVVATLLIVFLLFVSVRSLIA